MIAKTNQQLRQSVNVHKSVSYFVQVLFLYTKAMTFRDKEKKHECRRETLKYLKTHWG